MATTRIAAESTEAEQEPLRAIKRGNKAQISITFEPQLLARLTKHAQEMSVSRPALVAIAVSEYLNKNARSA
jgi:hypothetical protein